MKCFIVDDKQFSIEQITRHIVNTPGYEVVGSNTDPVRALSDILTGKVQIDLLFLDVDMPGIDGLEFERQIKGKAYVIFISGHRKYAVEAFESEAKAYLLKPVSYSKFLTAVEKVNNLFKVQQSSFRSNETDFMIKLNGKKHKKVLFETIVYIQASDNYMELHLNDNTTHVVNITMKKLLEILPAKTFVRIHHSYAVNWSYVTIVLGNTIRMKTGITLDISRAYKKEVSLRFNSY
ncbi:LytR/AlgR family response regulator transcription factor [Sphingobacterium detergens]|uniref:LytTR family two component transcriptional regulator n=1 Tax=Sphingobacterium detergens TaxID=1145106 RepID=A0A420ARW2_SPHD1|nr:LytTR family DNA-binding domain-containing protein [Sphingobacterium detergens]RKE47165.1 LytTR family two component transcriptional regulator [Sphingobacterium detergens]